MIKSKLLLNAVIFILCLSFMPLTAWAFEPQLPIVKVAINDDQSIINDRILYEALRRSGYEMATQVMGMRTALADVNYGDAAILTLQTDGLDKDYPNLIKVPVVFEYVEFTAYTRSDNRHAFSEWGDMAGLRLGYRLQNVYVTNNTWRAEAKTLVEMSTLEEVWASLLNNETDVVILPRMAHYEHRYPQGVKKAGVIELQPCYTYVNNKYDYLVPLLENAYREMLADGTIESIKNNIDNSNDKQIMLHLYSYNEQIEWERNQMDSIRKTLETESNLAYRSINLNSNELHSQAGFNSIISDMIRSDYLTRFPAMIVASGNEALEFVLNNYYLLFPQTPVFFFGVNGLDDSMLYGLEDFITGVSETVSFHETASEMLRLYPKTQSIFVLNDQHISRSIAMREEIQESLAARGLPVDVVFSEDKLFAELLDDIRDYGADTLVVIGSCLSDVSGTFFSETDVQKQVSAASGNPVFCLTASYNGYGTIGGLLSGTEAYDSVISARMSDILKGTPPGTIPVVFDSAHLNQWQFDYETAKRFNIDVNSLPAGHIALNRRLPVWESNPQEFGLMLAVAALLSLIICGLIVFSRMLKKKQEEAETASDAKSAFISSMSHEIRTPMNAIIGMAELSLRENIPPTIQEYMLSIRQAGSNLLGIINDVLDFSKIESGNMDLIIDEYTLSSLINDVIHTIRARTHAARLRFVVNVDSQIPNVLVGDVIKIRQIVLNLLSNAVKYTEKGFVSLSVNGKTMDDDTVMLSIDVSDSGTGIEQQDLDRLFDRFMRLEKTNVKNVEGTGLGLAITKNLIDAMNGEIEVQSVYGEGSTFTVRLPQQVKNHVKLAVVANTDGKNVLIFERRKILIDSIVQTMDSLGVNYEIVATTSEFCEKLVSNKYSHVFVAAVLYENAKKYSGELKTDTKIMLVAEFGEVVNERDISVLTTPIFSIPVADFLNGVSSFAAINVTNMESGRYIAPEAIILSVDDIDTNLSVLEGLLKPYKVLVVSCKSGLEAIEAVKAAPYDLVFMDHMMPDMNGIEATQRIRALKTDYPYIEEMPIVALTANAAFGAKAVFLNNGFNDFLSKPIDLLKLHDMLIKWIPADKWEKVGLNNAEMRRAPAYNIIINGVNVERGIATTGGTLENYIKTLDVFYKDGMEKINEINACLASNDMPLYTTHVHALKTAAANIGAEGLSEAARALEEAGREGHMPMVISESARLLEAFEELLAEINTVLSENRYVQSISVDMPLITDELFRLKEAIESFDSSSIKICADNLQKFSHAAGIGGTIDDILRCVLIGDDVKALSLIDPIVQENNTHRLE